MSCTFAEAWDLLLSDSESGAQHCPPESAMLNLHSSLTPNELPQVTSTPEDTAHQRDSFPDSTTSATLHCLTNLHGQLQLLQRASSLLDHGMEVQRVAQLSDNIDQLMKTISHPRRSEPAVQRQDPQPEYRCWDPCCGGRVFSNRSNLIRHQREQSGEKAQFRCSFCSARFSRGSARNAHEAKGACRSDR
ncbi:hypothetical protein BDV29DRAFT_155265 [Aspergillus leporis]|uniref:C2H2-type domain-containing protein n=1 Tax=Aspergillus leporis TaxID=41062 RepID=A0A5N5X5E7_9EURO|nr:hypothetical protein BDV29DRAFT_155265 [Aspergillus leporis]